MEHAEWQALAQHRLKIDQQHMRDCFAADLNRFDQFSLQFDGILFDYSRNRINEQTIPLLCALAHAVKLPHHIAALFSGNPVNETEKRPALHTALRDNTDVSILVNGKNIAPDIRQARERAYQLVNRIQTGQHLGATGKPIQHIINIGIGGSGLGPKMCLAALKDFANSPLRFHFISSVDQCHVQDVLDDINPDTSLFIISSKSFTTLETLTNARTVYRWLKEKLGDCALDQHFIAVTADHEKASTFGIPSDYILPIWDWVGGRYSIWSSIGFPLMLLIGTQQFEAFLAGAFQMDNHFKQAPLEKNMPVILALLSIWYMNFYHASVQAIAPYSHRLRYLIPYLQQAEMESNGKHTGLQGHALPYTTGPVIFGGEGCNGQHSYHQLLHQGQHLIPVDFILVGHQDMLIASALSQAQALMCGKTIDQAYNELISKHYSEADAAFLAKHQTNPGNRPSNILFLERMTPTSLGSLLALYEHKIFVQSVIWNINPFDQWGVELGKQLLPAILNQIQESNLSNNMDCATAGLIKHFKKTETPA
jgi:glucose-6-phosphate isomerase